VSFRGEYSSLPLSSLLMCGPPATAPQWVRPGLLDSQVPPARSQKDPPHEIRVVVRCDVAPGAMACFEVLANQRVDDW
jgi:hypothetical protein